MGREAQDVTESELSLLQVLWDRGRCSTRQLTDVLYPNGGASGYATVQKLLERLEAKGLVSRDRSLFVHTFTAVADRDELIGRRLRSLADKLCGGSLAPIVSHLARNQGLTREERAALRALIDAAPSPLPRASTNPARTGRERKE
jgi:BlaI family transcriptional regulator, penicillinase repressor